MTDDDLITSALKVFFTEYKPSKNENAADLVAVYRMALEDLPGWAIQRAVKAFIKGKVAGFNCDFRPKAGRLAQEAENQITLEMQHQNAHIYAEQRRLRADGRSDAFRHRLGELKTRQSIVPGDMPALPSDNFTALIEHRVDPAMQAKLAKVIPLNTNTTKEAG